MFLKFFVSFFFFLKYCWIIVFRGWLVVEYGFFGVWGFRVRGVSRVGEVSFWFFLGIREGDFGERFYCFGFGKVSIGLRV